jgi:hypothetical protein
MARRPLRDPISDLISDMSRAIIGTASNFQDNVGDVTEGLTQQIASAVAAESIPTLTSEIRRTLSGSRTRPSAGTGPLPLNGTASPQPNQPDSVLKSFSDLSELPPIAENHVRLVHHGNIDDSVLSKGFEYTGDILHNTVAYSSNDQIKWPTDSRFSESPAIIMDVPQDVHRQHARLSTAPGSLDGRYVVGRVAVPGSSSTQPETLDEGARRRAAEAAEIVNSIPGFGGGGNRIPPVDPPDEPQSGVNFTMPEREQESLDEGARRRAAETAAIVESIPGFGGGGNRIPPVDPPGPPDPPDDDPPDENDFFRRFTEWLQRFTGVMPDPREFDTLLNNVTDVLGGQPAQPDDPTRPSPLAGFMTAFSDYFNTPQLSPEAQIRAEQDLTEAVEELTQAVTGNTRTRSGTTPRANRTANWIRRRAQRAVVGTAKVMARMARPFARSFNNLIPQNMRAQMTQWGAQVVGQQARNLGVPVGTAVRFGASLGPAAALVGGAMIAAPIVGAIVTQLNKWSAEALVRINRVAQYNGDLFSGQKTLEMGRLQRDIAAANISGSSGRARFKAENDAEQSWAPWENFKTGSGNLWGTGMASASGLMGDVVNESMAALPRVVELLGYLSNLESIQRFGQKAIDFWLGGNNGNADVYRASAMGAWVSEEANGQAAQDQRRRARRPLGPQP